MDADMAGIKANATAGVSFDDLIEVAETSALKGERRADSSWLRYTGSPEKDRLVGNPY